MALHMANFPEGLRSGVINNATAILMGHVLTRDPVDHNLVVRCAAGNSAAAVGVAMYDGGAQNTEIGYATGGDVMVRNTSGASIAANLAIVSDVNGGVRAAAAGEKNLLGKTNVAIADGEAGSCHINVVEYI